MLISQTRMRVRRDKGVLLQVALAFALIIVSQVSAMAGTAQYNGAQPATYSGGDIFSVSGNTVTITGANTPTFLNVNGAGNEQLLGISGIWIVGPSGTALPGVSSLTKGGSVSPSSPTIYWTPESGPAGYGGTTGYSPGGTWIDLVSSGTLSTYGKTPSAFDLGTFNFTGLSGLSGYDFGIDYMIANGNGSTKTGRAYFDIPTTPNTPGVPEPGSVTTFCIGGIVLAASIVIARRRLRAKT